MSSVHAAPRAAVPVSNVRGAAMAEFWRALRRSRRSRPSTRISTSRRPAPISGSTGRAGARAAVPIGNAPR